MSLTAEIDALERRVAKLERKRLEPDGPGLREEALDRAAAATRERDEALAKLDALSKAVRRYLSSAFDQRQAAVYTFGEPVAVLLYGEADK